MAVILCRTRVMARILTRTKSEVKGQGPGEEPINNAMIRKRRDTASIGVAVAGDEFMQHLRTAGISAKPIIAKLGLDKFDFAFA